MADFERDGPDIPWAQRADFARHSDFADPRFKSLLEQLRASQQRFTDRLGRTSECFDNRWTRGVWDVLSNWSRRWEYPYAASVAEGGLGRVLEAGCGFGFFPFWWAEQGYAVAAVDADAGYIRPYAIAREQIAAASVEGRAVAERVEFSVQGIAQLKFPDDHFDVVSCVSVLEHLPRPGEAVAEFARVVKPEGTVVLTCDVSLDGTSTIRPAAFLDLLRIIEERFVFSVVPRFRFAGDVLTTDHARATEPQSLPWQVPEFRWRWLANPQYYLNPARYTTPAFYSVAVVGMKLRKRA